MPRRKPSTGVPAAAFMGQSFNGGTRELAPPVTPAPAVAGLGTRPAISDAIDAALAYEPGPWHVGDTGDQMNPCFAVYSSHGGCIADWIGSRANARLIAQAPAMLAKLEKLAEYMDRLAAHDEQQATDLRFPSLARSASRDAKNWRATAADVRTVIAKARGGAT